MKERNKRMIYFFTVVLILLLISTEAHADVIFPAIANQFMVSAVVPSYWSVVMAIVILSIETFFIKKLLSTGIVSSFAGSVLVNLASSVVGVFISAFAFSAFASGIFAYKDMRLGTYLGMIPGYILTVLLEGTLLFMIALMIKKKVKMIECIRTSALMNFFSYLIILTGVFIADVVTSGGIFKIFPPAGHGNI